MRLPRPRLSLQRTMLGLAAITIAIKGTFLVDHWQFLSRTYDRRASKLSFLASFSRREAQMSRDQSLEESRKDKERLLAVGLKDEDIVIIVRDPARARLLCLYYDHLIAKYRRLARYPWLPNPPDPPPP